MDGGKGAVRWQVWGAGLGSVTEFEEVRGAEGLVGKVMGETWWECWCPRGFGVSTWSGEVGRCHLGVAGEFEL